MKITKYSQLRHGMRVRCKIRNKEVRDAKISINSNGGAYICQNTEGWSTAENGLGYEYSWILADHETPYLDLTYISDLRTVGPSLEDAEVGDILVNTIGSKLKVLAKTGLIWALSHCSEFDEYGDWYTLEELYRHGCKFDIEEEQKKPETIKIGDIEFDKKEVEQRLEGLEPVK